MMEHFDVNLNSNKYMELQCNQNLFNSSKQSLLLCTCLGTRIVEVIKVLCFEPFFYSGVCKYSMLQAVTVHN